MGSSASFSAENNVSLFSTLKQGHIILELGAYQGIQGQKQLIYIQDLIGDTFTVNDRHDNNGLIGLGYFLDGQNLGRVKMSYGLNGFYLAKTTVSGNVIQENIFNNLSYNYNLMNYPVYLMAKSSIDFNSRYALTLDGGIGPDFMKAYGFSEQSLDGGVTIPEKPFSSHTSTTLSGTLGIGIKINHVISQVPLECGYRFFYLGQGHFYTNTNQLLNTLNTGKTYANAVICSVSI